MPYSAKLYVFFILLVGVCLPLQAQDITLLDAERCQGESVNLATLVNAGGVAIDHFYSWSANGEVITTASINYNVSPSITTIYTLDYSVGGNRRQKSLTVTIYELPDFTVPEGGTVCCGEGVKLEVTLRNASAAPIISWRDNNNHIHDNGRIIIILNTSQPYKFTATVSNNVQCASVSKSFTVNGLINPTSSSFTINNTGTVCKTASINLNDRVGFKVVDSYGNEEPASISSGTITWYTAKTGGVAIPADVIVNSSSSFYADYNDVTVDFNNTCSTYSYTFSGQARREVAIDLTSSTFARPESNAPCRGDSLKINYRLIDSKTGELSSCDSIKEINFLRGSKDSSLQKISKTVWRVQYEPFTNAKDSIIVEIVSWLGTRATYTHKLILQHEPKPFSGDVSGGYVDGPPAPVCKGDNVVFYVMANDCDTIQDVTFTGLKWKGNDYAYTVDKETMARWKFTVSKLMDSLTFAYKIDYTSNYKEKDTIQTGRYQLVVHSEKPTGGIYVNYYSSFNASPNLCFGDTLRHTFSPGPCDTLKSITWSGDLTPQPVSAYGNYHEYIVKPGAAGVYNYKATIKYRRSTDLSDSTEVISFMVNVVNRPYLFLNKQSTDTTKFCFDAPGAKIDLNTNGRINYTYIIDGTAYFSIMNVQEYVPFDTKNFDIYASYKYLCSEMYDYTARGTLRTVVDRDSKTNIIPAYDKFCVSSGVNLTTGESEGTNARWEHNGTRITLPYYPAAGSHTLNLVVSNSCYSEASLNVPVVVDPLPVVQAMKDTSVCSGTMVTLKVVPGSIGVISWNPSSPAVIYQTSTFTATATNACGSVNDQVVIFRIPEALVVTRGDTSVCYNDWIHLNTVAHEGTLTWWDRYGRIGGTPPEAHIRADEVFTVEAKNVCGSAIAYLNVFSIPLPFVEVAPDTTVCYNVPFVQQVHRSVGVLTWEPDNVPHMIDPVTFVVTATVDKCGSYKDTMEVNVYPELFIQPTILPKYQRLKPYDLQFKTKNAKEPEVYSFYGYLPKGVKFTSNGISGTPIMGPLDYNTQLVSVLVIDGHNCMSERIVDLKPEWSAATAFNPLENNDNAVFLPGFEVEIFTRNGVMIYKGTGWDGKSNNSLVAAGTYFYRATVFIDGISKQFTGYITVMY